MNGVLAIDKPEGFTSFDVIAVMRGCTKVKKIGHTGTLDPMATGVLPLLFGKATKAADLILDHNKQYVASFQIGQKMDTGDRTGQIVGVSDITPNEEELKAAVSFFTGEISQVPPMYSAVSVGGKRLYQLARKGIEVERASRTVVIEQIELLSYDPLLGRGVLFIACSKGTYIRTLIEDIVEKLDTVAHMTALRRTYACGIHETDAITLEQAKMLAEGAGIESSLKPIDAFFKPFEKVKVTEAQAVRFQNGGALDLERLSLKSQIKQERIRVYNPTNSFLGLGIVDDERGQLKILKLF